MIKSHLLCQLSYRGEAGGNSTYEVPFDQAFGAKLAKTSTLERELPPPSRFLIHFSGSRAELIDRPFGLAEKSGAAWGSNRKNKLRDSDKAD